MEHANPTQFTMERHATTAHYAAQMTHAKKGSAAEKSRPATTIISAQPMHATLKQEYVKARCLFLAPILIPVAPMENVIQLQGDVKQET